MAPAPGATTAEIIVTGSRVVSNGNAQPVPVTVVSAERLMDASPKGVADALIQLPSFSSSNSREAGGAAANAGHTYLNLRGLGVQRNLVLLDGRRFVATSDGGAPDINLFPQELLQRVEVVTGGASAAYGSDAVAGVTNFVLDTDFSGVKGMTSGAVTQYGDDKTFRASVAAGHAFLNDRLHVVASFDYTDSAGVKGFADGGPDRDWQSRGRFLITNPAVTAAHPASPTNPGLIVGNDVRFPYASPGGVISGGPLKGTQFLPGGGTGPFNYGTNPSTGYTQGGDGATSAGDANLETPLHSEVGFLHANFKVTEHISLYAEGEAANTSVFQDAGPDYGFNSTAYTIYNTDAYLPANIRNQLSTLNLASFPLGRFNTDLGTYRKTIDSQTLRGVVGAKGAFGQHWDWDAYYEHGQNRGKFEGHNDIINNNLYNAVDAVVNPATGGVVCRTTLTNPANGCVPIDLFGQGSPSAAAIKYIMGTPSAVQRVTQDVVAGTLRGQPVSTWAGPVKTAIGYEHRREGLTQSVDPLSTTTAAANGVRGFPASLVGTQGSYFLGNSNPVSGSYTVDEVFGEAAIPLAVDLPLAKLFEGNVAGRFTRYSSVGYVSTWKLGAVYAPIEDFRLRTTLSRDVRAPNVGELYLSQAQTISTVLDSSRNNVATTATIILPGNADLKAESSKTLTYGGIFQPHWLHGFSTSVDVYSINIANAIGRLSNQQTVDQCAQGNAALCALITRTDTGIISVISTPNLNLANMKENGVDIEMNYVRNLSDLSRYLEGRLALRALATDITKLASTTQGSPPIDRARQTPFQMTLSGDYALGPFGVYAQGRYLGPRQIDTTYTTSTIANNHIDAVWYADVTLTYKPPHFLADYQLFLTINNLFDRDPPTGVLTGSTQGTPTITSFYDIEGRYYTAGLRFNF